MADQSQLFPPPPPEPPPPSPPPAGNVASAAGPVWLQRMSLFILVIFCVYLGGILVAMPWWTAVWDQNLFFSAHPRLWAVLRLGPVRGVISGVGLLDIWIGISEAVNYRDRKRASDSHEN